jgi:2'-5' RNA ligase
MPRLFTGLEVPVDVATTLAMLRGGLPGARWVEPADYHITLRFLGDIDDRLAREVDEALAELDHGPLQITLEALACFGGDRPHSVYAAVRPNRALMELQAAQERLLRRMGLPAGDGRKFTPHVTLARLRGAHAADVAAYISARGRFPVMQFEAERFVLFSARASTGGGPYLVEATYPLGQPWLFQDWDEPDTTPMEFQRA